jgi:hypothetical protein
VALGEDPRLFWLRGRPFFSAQRAMVGEGGRTYAAGSREQVFRNVLVDASTGRYKLRERVRGNTEACFCCCCCVVYSQERERGRVVEVVGGGLF